MRLFLLHLNMQLLNLPVYQNKMFDTTEAALACPRGDVLLAQGKRSEARAAYEKAKAATPEKETSRGFLASPLEVFQLSTRAGGGIPTTAISP